MVQCVDAMFNQWKDVVKRKILRPTLIPGEKIASPDASFELLRFSENPAEANPRFRALFDLSDSIQLPMPGKTGLLGKMISLFSPFPCKEKKI